MEPKCSTRQIALMGTNAEDLLFNYTPVTDVLE